MCRRIVHRLGERARQHSYGELNLVVPLGQGATPMGPNGWHGPGRTTPGPGSRQYPEARGGALVALSYCQRAASPTTSPRRTNEPLLRYLLPSSVHTGPGWCAAGPAVLSAHNELSPVAEFPRGMVRGTLVRGRTRVRLDSFQKMRKTVAVPTTTEFERMLRGAALRVTRPRIAVLDAVYAHPHADTDTIIGAVRGPTSRDVSHQAIYDVLKALTTAGLVRRIQPIALGGALRVPGRGQPPPRRVPLLRRHRRRRLRGRRRALPDRRPTTTASPSTRPRSSTGACAPTAPPQPVSPSAPRPD